MSIVYVFLIETCMLCYILHSFHLFIYHLSNFWKTKKIKIFILNVFFNVSFLMLLLSVRKLGRHRQNSDMHCEPVANVL